MKKLVLTALLLLALIVCVPVRAQQGTKTAFAAIVLSNGVTEAKAMSTTNLLVMRLTFVAKNGAAVSNSATIYVGPSTNAQPKNLLPGEEAIIQTTPGTCFNLKDWFWRSPTSTDVLTVIYQ